MGFFARKKH
jgi:hypothetical protein